MFHFKATVTQVVSEVLGIEYHLHCSWRTQSSGKVEKANDIIKIHLCKLTQEMQDNWINVLPIALMRAQAAPKKQDCPPLNVLMEGLSYSQTLLLTLKPWN